MIAETPDTFTIVLNCSWIVLAVSYVGFLIYHALEWVWLKWNGWL